MQVPIKKSEILACLKKQKILPMSEVELISIALDNMHKKPLNNAIVDFKGNNYQRRFLP